MRSVIRLVTFLVIIGVIIAVWYCEDRPDPRKTALPPQTPAEDSRAPSASPGPETPSPWPPLGSDDLELAPNKLLKNYYVILDGSGSMSEQQCYGDGTKMAVARESLAAFARLVPGSANLGLSIFINNRIEELVPLGQDNRQEFIAAVRATYPSGQTPLRSAMETGFGKLTDQARRQLGYGEYMLVVVTDGLASPGEDPTGIVHTILDQTPVAIQTIGFCIGDNHPLNIPGRTVFKAANSEDELRRGLEDVLAESATFDVSDFKGIR